MHVDTHARNIIHSIKKAASIDALFQVQRVCSMNMRARRHRYLSAAAAAFRLLLVTTTLHRRRRLHHHHQQQVASASRTRYHLSSALASWLKLHRHCNSKRNSFQLASCHFRRVALTRIVWSMRARCRYVKMLHSFAVSAGRVCLSMLMDKVMCGWLDLRPAWRAKRQR